MSTTAAAAATTVDRTLWIPVVAVPIMCFVVDGLIGRPVLRHAPAALPSLVIIGIACLVISRRHRQGFAGLATIGPMWLVGGLTILLHIALFLTLTGLALISSFFILTHAISWQQPSLIPLGLVGLALGLLGCTPAWTAITYIIEAHALTEWQAARHGRWRTALPALLGAAAAAVILIAAELVTLSAIDRRLSAIDSEAPVAWEAALRSLGGFPLCGLMCHGLVCERLLQRFPRSVPAPVEDSFSRTFRFETRARRAYGLTDRCGTFRETLHRR